MSFSVCAQEPEKPVLFESQYVTKGKTAWMEKLVTKCRRMPAKDVSTINDWLRSGKWKNGMNGMPTLQSPGTFIFAEPGTDKCLAVSLLADVRHVYVARGTVNPKGKIKMTESRIWCVENPEIAKILETEIKRSFPEGVKMIKENAEMVKENAELERKQMEK
jgi:hypothetical protein